jgi:hypothetical protein
MVSQSGVTSNGTNGRGSLNSWAAIASFRGLIFNKSITTPNEQTNNGFTTVQYPSRNQPKAISRNFTDQRLILIGSRNNDWQKDVKVTRDRLNKELQAKLNSQQLIIASITKASYSENVILVATFRFIA